MGLRSKLRAAEDFGAKAAHLGAQRIRTGLQNLETSLHSRGSGGNLNLLRSPGSIHPDPEQQREASPNSKVRTGIVSVNGQDVGEMRCTGGRS
jgi:hypothetical protein